MNIQQNHYKTNFIFISRGKKDLRSIPTETREEEKFQPTNAPSPSPRTDSHALKTGGDRSRTLTNPNDNADPRFERIQVQREFYL